jgi:hypothetical protein
MFEVIISSVNTGRVRRKLLDSREEADRFIDRFLVNPNGPRERSRRDYRIEVVFRDAPEVFARLAARRRPSAVPAA